MQVATVNQLLLQEKENIQLNKKLSAHQKKHLKAIGFCRTKYLGGRKLECNNCKASKIIYNSCRNRHCPQCQTVERENWIAARENDLLPVKYFHLVFTLPSELNYFAMLYAKQVYNALFTASWQTLKQFASDKKWLGAKTGMTSILHTWGQNLSLHPHLHCIVPNGGIDEKSKWKTSKSKGKYLFNVKAMSTVFRAKYMEALRANLKQINKSLPKDLTEKLFSKNWVVYAKKPFGNAKTVVEYLGRYSHKVAISNSRILSIENNEVKFSYKDYKQNGKKKIMTLSKAEFIRRFAQHILPAKFMRIRHYGIMSSRNKKTTIPKIRKQLEPKSVDYKIYQKQDFKTLLLQKYKVDVNKCKQCKIGELQEKEKIPGEWQKPKLHQLKKMKGK